MPVRRLDDGTVLAECRHCPWTMPGAFPAEIELYVSAHRDQHRAAPAAVLLSTPGEGHESAAAVPVHRFRAVWPVDDPQAAPSELLTQAAADLDAVAGRHALAVTHAGPPRLMPGRAVPGSGGAALVVVIDALVQRLRDVATADEAAAAPRAARARAAAG
ncbi:hypothetical protein [Cellulomonas oligotrophica]|uniref:Uncharacterized protein n=1 Tax=Cellulomonas oligotrophica TaxID=931536 RepID=A0A7Y9FIF3_9CELL|nr:hypothetical protein [Cellulomonas oligotrophica]NYD87794.1 hypothetical protein [Cellulomonas oligotrophica]